MRTTVASRDLTRELMFLEKIVGKKSTIPVLSNVLLQGHDGWLHLAATDLEIALTTACQATVHEPGAITLPAKKLFEIVKLLPEEDIVFTTDARGQVRCSGVTFNARLQTLPAEDFPVLPHTPEHPPVLLQRDVLLDGLKKTIFATADDKRFFMNGALLMLPDQAQGMVAVDGKRLALLTALRAGPAAPNVLIPLKTMELLVALLSESSVNEVSFTQTDRHLFFDLEGRLLISRMVDGKFPAWERILPKDNIHVATIDRGALIIAIQRVILISEVVLLQAEAHTLRVSAANVLVGDADEIVKCDYPGPSLEMKLNGRYVLDFLTAATGVTVTMALKDDKSPALFVDCNYSNVILRIK
jgi:DNA polymerase-3 subunit beta